MKTRIHRRTLLKGLLGGAAISIGLPPLECFINANGTAYAGGLYACGIVNADFKDDPRHVPSVPAPSAAPPP